MCYNNSVIKALLLALILIEISGRISVFHPPALREKFGGPKHDMPYALAKFGTIPYGKRLMGNIIYPDPSDGCSSYNVSSASGEQDELKAPIILVDRGKCTFVTKTKYAQLVGAQMVIIIDSTDENISTLIMADDGHGSSIHIPTVMISKADGAKFTAFIEANPSTKITISAIFSQPGDVGEVNAQFWFSSSDQSAYDFLADFQQYNRMFDNSLSLIPHYILWYSAGARMTDPPNSVAEENCLSGGRFCAPDPDGTGPTKGSDVVLEDLRQLCVFNTSKRLWWVYAVEFGKECAANDDFTTCYDTVLDHVGASGEQKDLITACIRDSFESTSDIPNNALDNNVMLRAELDAYGQSGISYWPSITINHSPYKDALLPSIKVAEAICDKYTDKPDFCNDIQGKYNDIVDDDAGTHYLAVFTILIVLIVVLLGMLYCYKRMMRREMTKEMSIQISQMVSQYFALNEGKGGRPGDNL